MFSTVVLEKTLESPLDYKTIKPVNPKGYQHWMFIRRNAEAEAPIFWPPHAKTWLIGKDSDAGKDKSQKKGIAEDEMVVWHLWLNGHEFEQATGVGEVQGSLKCYSPWGCRAGHNWVTELNWRLRNQKSLTWLYRNNTYFLGQRLNFVLKKKMTLGCSGH